MSRDVPFDENVDVMQTGQSQTRKKFVMFTPSSTATNKTRGSEMAEVERYMKEIVEISCKAQEISREFNRLCGGSFEWATKEIASSYLSMFDRFCPFKIGDRVRLVKDYEVTDKSHSWYHCRHFLQKGALATIITRGYDKSYFTFQIEFDIETWISSQDKIERPVSCKHTFYFPEHYLEIAPNNNGK